MVLDKGLFDSGEGASEEDDNDDIDRVVFAVNNQNVEILFERNQFIVLINYNDLILKENRIWNEFCHIFKWEN